MTIDCQQIKKLYHGKTVLDGVSLKVNVGECYGLVGVNGSGKSTLIKAILDLVAIDDGLVTVDGVNHRVIEARKNIAYLPDRFAPPPHLQGGDFLQYMMQLHGSNASEEQLEAVLQALELRADSLREPVNRFSKGMTQKLGLIACLLSGKSLFILDEPMSGLDPRARVLFKQQLASLKEKGATVFFSSHALLDVDEIADRMAVLDRGKIRFEGTPKAFVQQYDAADIEEAYMACVESEL